MGCRAWDCPAIRQCRVEAGLSQEQLAEKADLHPVYVGKVERGEQWISPFAASEQLSHPYHLAGR